MKDFKQFVKGVKFGAPYSWGNLIYTSCQYIQKSINKQTAYDNLVLEQDILSKKK